MKKYNTFLLFNFLCLFMACQSSTNTQQSAESISTNAVIVEESMIYEQVSPKVFAQKMSETKKVQLVDVRTPVEYESGHLENAININVNSENFAESMKVSTDTEQTLFIYCRSGRRSGRASEILKEMGYKEIYDLRGGYNAWSKNQ